MLARFVHTSGWIKQQWETPWVRRAFLVSIFSLLAALFVVWPAGAQEPDLLDLLTGYVAKLVFTFASFLVGILAWLISALITVAQYNNFIHDEGVIIGWTLVRDVANMFFVVVLLIIAFGTILGRSDFHMKNTLFRFVATAILINFSRLIIGVMIDIVQVIMMTFVNAIAQVGGGNFIQAFQLNDAFRVAQTVSADAGDMLMTAILSAVLIAVAVIMVGMFALLLVYRMATLWVLIVMSPVAFLLGAIPSKTMGFSSYYNEWWGYLKGNLLVGPVAAFFLWLALAMVGDGNIFAKVKSHSTSNTAEAEAALNRAETGVRPKEGITNSAISSIENLSSFLIAAAIFSVAFDMTQKVASQMGGKGGSYITGKAGSLTKNVLTGNVRGALGDIPLGGKVAAGFDRVAKPFKEVYGAYAAEHGIGATYDKAVTRGYDAVIANVGLPGERETARSRIADRVATKRGKLEENYGSQTSTELNAAWQNSKSTDKVAMAKVMLERGDQMDSARYQEALAAANRTGDSKGSRELQKLAGKHAPQLNSDFSSVEGAQEAISRPGTGMENLDTSEMPQAHVDNIVNATLAREGSDGVDKLIKKTKRQNSKDSYVESMPAIIANASVDQEESREQVAQIDAQLLEARREVQRLDRGEQTGRARQQLQAAQQRVTQLRNQRSELQGQVEAPLNLAVTHTENTGRPDRSVSQLQGADRNRTMDHIVRKIKQDKLEPEAINAEVLGSARRVYGDNIGDWLKKLKPEQDRVAKENARAIDSSSASVEQVEAKILMTGDFSGLNNRGNQAEREQIMQTSVSAMSAKQMAKVRLDSLQGDSMANFLNALRSNPKAVRGLNKVDGVSQALLDRIEAEVNTNYNSGEEGTEAWGELKRTVDSWESQMGQQIRRQTQELQEIVNAQQEQRNAEAQAAAQQAEQQNNQRPPDAAGGADFDNIDLG